ncbi:Hybrid sensor histidine kinase/response regulator [Flavobacterium sp. 9AF]|uniref:ATP-binding protein n=1 Tax=Flavobacterium sp. 9AF TaxID=2653142 RepID=UPI0012F22491|nr:ATP-binding protein [Flavobacterium sp. 9AF]VXB85734.1 Hybrid sensor histidine kinase/response regulator [Flavobacterium sp. 9AF]
MNYFKVLLFIITFSFFNNVISQNAKEKIKTIKEYLSESGKYLHTSQPELSLQNAKKALALAIKKKDESSIAKAYNFIGLNFVEIYDFEKAIDYYNKALLHAENTNNDTIKSWLYNNLGNVYSYNKNDEEAGIKYYLKSLEYARKVDIVEFAYNKLNLVNTYFEKKKFEEGKIHLDEVRMHIDSLVGEHEAQFFFYSLNGDYEEYKGNLSIAENNLLKALKICQSKYNNFNPSHEVGMNESLSKFYFKRKQYDKAYKYLLATDSLRQIAFELQRNEKVKGLVEQIEKEEVKRDLIKMEADKRIQDEKFFNIKILIILIGVIFLTTLTILYSQLKLNKIRRKSNEELREANEELRIAKEKAEEASKIKSQFVSTISHELRTPLYGVIGITDIIEVEHHELKNSPHLKALKFSANYLLSLVNDILKVYKFEENKVVLENNLFNLEDKLETIKNSLDNIALKYNNDIIIKVDKKIPEYIIGDSVRLSQIILNLVSNSLKFTHNGKVTITADLDYKNKEQIYIKFKVIDTGVGIPKEFQEKVFDKFVQINRKEDDYQGTGLGLTIVKKLIELFKGDIHLESEENKGTTITFTIPFESGKDKVNDFINNIDVDLSLPKTYKILVVEDNKINQIVTKKLLENHKFQCEIADDGFVALELLESQKFDAILMDINMPKINGFETTKLIRQKGFTIPIIAVTAFEKEEVQIKAKQAGIDDIIAKPFDTRKLFQMIRLYINSKEEELN